MTDPTPQTTGAFAELAFKMLGHLYFLELTCDQPVDPARPALVQVYASADTVKTMSALGTSEDSFRVDTNFTGLPGITNNREIRFVIELPDPAGIPPSHSTYEVFGRGFHVAGAGLSDQTLAFTSYVDPVLVATAGL